MTLDSVYTRDGSALDSVHTIYLSGVRKSGRIHCRTPGGAQLSRGFLQQNTQNLKQCWLCQGRDLEGQ